MAGKRIDYSGRIALYHEINKKRNLTQEEQDRLDWLIKREREQKKEAAYRERHKQRLHQQKQEYQKSPRGREVNREANKRAYWKNPQKRRELAKQWRLANPEKYEEQKRIKNERRRRVRKEAEHGGM